MIEAARRIETSQSSTSVYGGRGGIRTHGTLAGTPVFKTGALNHSATLPCLKDQPLHEWPPRTQGEHEARESDLRHPCRLLHCIGRSARDDIPGEPADRVIGARKSSRPRRPALLVSPDAWRRRRLGPNTMSTPA